MHNGGRYFILRVEEKYSMNDAKLHTDSQENDHAMTYIARKSCWSFQEHLDEVRNIF